MSHHTHNLYVHWAYCSAKLLSREELIPALIYIIIARSMIFCAGVCYLCACCARTLCYEFNLFVYYTKRTGDGEIALA